MPKFGKRSKENLATVDERLQAIHNKVIEWFDHTVTEGHRGEEAQNKAFKEGKSKIKFPDGKHNKIPSLATDSAPYPIDFRGGGDLQKAIQKYAEQYHKLVVLKNLFNYKENLDYKKQLKLVEETYAEIIDITYNIQKWYLYIGALKGTADTMGIKIRSGADWDGDNQLDDQTFNDIGHIELVN